MPNNRKRKLSVVSDSQPSAGASVNRNSSRALIRKYHCLLKQRVQLLKQKATPRDVEALTEVERQIDELGGLGVYQRMSSIGQGKDRGGGSEKVLIKWLREECSAKSTDPEKAKLRLLEVGALKHDNYCSCMSWIDVTPIDLHSRHPSILEQDFLLMDEMENREKWDIVSLSLVINFVPNPKDRGGMLRLARTMLRSEGLLFLALPLPCVFNSRYLTFEHLQELMSAVGFTEVKSRWKEGGKMAYWLYRKTEPDGCLADRFQKKKVLRQGNRNNYVILL